MLQCFFFPSSQVFFYPRQLIPPVRVIRRVHENKNMHILLDLYITDKQICFVFALGGYGEGKSGCNKTMDYKKTD